ncbi:MAG: hypothetical protein ACLQHK_13100 [Gallionellaceae bacterium]
MDKELDYYKSRQSDAEAILLAAKARGENGVKLDHQRRLKLVDLDIFATQLVAASHHWPRISAFSDLFLKVQLTANGVPGIGDLAVYDTALRIGWRFGVKPSEVYLQAGARKGAKRLVQLPRGRRSIPVSLFQQRELKVLVPYPYRIENFLCVSWHDL